MYKLSKFILVLAALAFTGFAAAQATKPQLGRAATPKEIAAWDIDVRPDFKGLPKGQGTVQKGAEVWDTKCASCHGTFGESNEVFTPIVGYTTKKDVETGRVKSLTDGGAPQKTTMMKVATVSTLWDYINRAMPWTQPKSLSVEEVYAVTAYILNLAESVPDDFTLSDKNIASVKLPNRFGITDKHGLWQVNGKGDTQNKACMQNCAKLVTQTSSLPDYARNAHGNLAEQNRTWGAIRGADTTKPFDAKALPQAGLSNISSAVVSAAPSVMLSAAPAVNGKPTAALNANACMGCHAQASKMVGPSFNEIAKKYAGRSDATAYLAGKIQKGGQGVWGSNPMPALPVSDADAKAVAAWLANGAK